MDIWPFNWKNGAVSVPPPAFLLRFYYFAGKHASTICFISPSCVISITFLSFSSLSTVSVSITISYPIQTPRGRVRERDEVEKKIIRMKNRIEERSCTPPPAHSLSVWITNNNRGVKSFRVEIKKIRKRKMGEEIYLLRYSFLFVIIIITLDWSSNTYILTRFKTDYFPINWFAVQKAEVPRTQHYLSQEMSYVFVLR